MTAELNLSAGSRIEFAFGKIHSGQEKYFGTEYFPAANPIMHEHGSHRLAGFGVIATNVQHTPAAMGAISAWPEAKNRQNLFEDDRFTKLLPRRDTALDLSDGHLFEGLDDVIALNTNSDYAIIVAEDLNIGADPILALTLAKDSANQDYQGKSMALFLWSDTLDGLMQNDSTKAEIFRVRFDPAG